MGTPFLCIAGKNNIAVDVLEYAIRHYQGYEIGVVCNRTETGENGFQRSLRNCAHRMNIREYTLEEVYPIENLVFLSLEFDRIIKPHLFRNARLYNIHFSLLPQYKGMYTSALPLLNGEKYVGVTLHLIDAGIDTGDVIDQEKFEVGTSNCKELYLKYISYGTKVVLRNLDMLLNGRVMAVPQESIGSTYFSKGSLDYSHIVIDLAQTACSISNQIRAFTFRDYQLPVILGKKVIDCHITNTRSHEKPGTVLLNEESFAVLSTIDYNIIIYYDRFAELLNACQAGDIGKVIEICAVRKHINEQDTNGWTPLIKGTYYNRVEIVKYLIALGADISLKNRNGTNLLMYAKEAYRRSHDNTLFKLLKRMGLSEYDSDYNGYNLLYYLEKEGITIEELTR